MAMAQLIPADWSMNSLFNGHLSSTTILRYLQLLENMVAIVVYSIKLFAFVFC